MRAGDIEEFECGLAEPRLTRRASVRSSRSGATWSSAGGASTTDASTSAVV
jgi:hypothetical protein